MSDESAQKIRTNPFYVLGLRPDVSRTEAARLVAEGAVRLDGVVAQIGRAHV